MLIAALVVYAASCEEQFLAEQFPEEFKAYVAAVPHKWWPARLSSPLPERVDVRPAVYWKSFLDAGSFFALWLLVAMAAEFRLAPSDPIVSFAYCGATGAVYARPHEHQNPRAVRGIVRRPNHLAGMFTDESATRGQPAPPPYRCSGHTGGSR